MLHSTITRPKMKQPVGPWFSERMIVAYLEVGKDTGDRPGEAQLWVERDHLDRVIEVPGMTHVVHANADGSEILAVVGPGQIYVGSAARTPRPLTNNLIRASMSWRRIRI